ncbi:MAG: DNA repair protein RecO [Candidatus Cloacimonadota bacterium]|nr:DNA repair protein RecO [Candidatus Cloacimonadota bacterium]
MSQRIEKCNAIALRVTNYSNTSQITQFITDRFGMIGVIAKGSRNPKSKMSGVLQTLSLYELVIYKKENSLSLLKEITEVNDNFELLDDIEKTTCAQAGAEIYLQLLLEENDYKNFFMLLQTYFTYLKSVKRNFIIIFWRFFLRVCSYLGFPLTFDKCRMCDSKNVDEMYGITFKESGFICKKCVKKFPVKENLKCNSKTIHLLASINNISSQINSLQLSRDTIREINSIFKIYLNYHLHKQIHLKSLEIIY